MDVLYVIGKYDDVVNESSAKGYWGNTKVKALPNGHVDIVKPKDSDDLSFLVFKNFLTSSESQEPKQKSVDTILSKTKDSPFTKKVFDALNFNRLVVCYSQDHSDITKEKELLKKRAKQSFKENFYNIEVPSFVNDEASYFQTLTSSAGLQCTVKSANEWKISMKKRLTKTSNRVLFFFTNIADKIVQELNNLKDDATLLCECLGKDWNENWCTWSYEESINTLFWKNILVNSNGKYAWRDEATKEMAKEVFGC
jgi:hypothetical protein